MSASNAAVSPASPRPEEGSDAEDNPKQHPTLGRDSNSDVGTKVQSEQNTDEPSKHNVTPAFPILLDEIRLLQERLFHLKGQAAQQWKATVEDVPSGDTGGDEKSKDTFWDGDKVLRKHMRKATGGRRLAENIEKHAEETAEERKAYGQQSNKPGAGHDKSTMYHVRPSGDLLPGDIMDAVYGDDGWFETHGFAHPGVWTEDVELRSRMNSLPHRGVRPPAAVRPFYETSGPRGSTNWTKLKLSRKLGPPTRWDESDSEEWSSATSTSSQDFKYFRARLRGDFEWELDRLNAQVLRYRKHQIKKRSRQEALRVQEDERTRKMAFEEHEKDEMFAENLGLGGAGAGKDEFGVRQLNPLGWSAFRIRRTFPLKYCYIIDVLIEEPKLSDYLKLSGRADKDKETSKKATSFRAAVAKDLSSKDDTSKNPKNPLTWTVQEPLPERIRINSKQIIDILSSIHGSPLFPDANESSSVTLLRPFKILHAYDKEIRERYSKLNEEKGVGTEIPSMTGEGQEKKQTNSDTAPEMQASEEQSDVKDESEAAKEDKSVSHEERLLQLEHLDCLRQFMDEYLGRKVAYLNSVSCGKIFFSDVWHLFRPGTTVISADGKQAYRVVNLKSKRHKGADRWAAFWDRRNRRKPRKSDSSSESSSDGSDHLSDNTRADITIRCVFIHFDGESFGPVVRTFHVNKWDGEKEVTYLDVYPIRFYVLKHLDKRSMTSTTKISNSVREEEVENGVQVLRQKLINRGRVFLEVAAMKQMYYSGLAIDTRDEIESQVMVDFEEALAHESRKSWIPKITRLVGTDWKPKTDNADEGCTAECCWEESVHDDAYVETRNTEKFIDDMMAEIKDISHKLPSAIVYPRTLEETKTEANALTEDELMIMSYSVFGFVLRDRTWAKLDLDCMSTVRSPGNTTEQTDDDLEEGGQGAFGQLVLPPGHKKMVLSLISQHFRNKGSQEGNDKQVDIVRGKGKGLIILLHGAPGVGKTTTAEGVAETFGQPLFQITCGDLGSTPKDVEAALQTNFALANRWGCILLLDEADVFLAERRRNDFNRNGLVAVFLRVLEYYAGILFLTTNRIGDFDEAFASRIHMSLHYPALDEVSTAKVFQLNLGMIKSRLQDRVKIEEVEIITAAGKHWREHKHARWNGRQIRNACQTALALAEFDAQPKGRKYDIKEKSTAKIHLKLSHLEIVSNAYLEFTDYLKAVHGADAEGRAKESGLRALDTLLDALKPDNRERSSQDRRTYSPERGQTGPETPYKEFRLRPSSRGQRSTPRMASPSSPEPASQHAAGHQGLYAAQQMVHEPPPLSAQRMQYNHGAYMGNQSFMGDQRSGVHPTSQQVQPGSYLQAPQSYTGAGRGDHGHYQSPDPYMRDDQRVRGHGVSYPSPPPSAARGGPGSGSSNLGHFGDDQSRQAHRGGQVPYDESEQI